MDKSSQTIWTVVLIFLIMIGAVYVFMHLWSIILGILVGLLFGFYFGWTSARRRK